MKDAQGYWRGRCNDSGCDCDVFMLEDAECSSCDYCGHPPSDHVLMALGPCTSCPPNECDEYVEDPGEEGKCSYCGCTPDDHSRCNCVTTIHCVLCSYGQLVFNSCAELQCKLAGCTKPRSVESERIHDFCGRSHAKQSLIREFWSSQNREYN